MIPKFRCWFKPENAMREITTMEFTDGMLDYICFDYEETGCDPESCILMQSTGLFDKNGVEIFEGDVVKRVRGRNGVPIYLKISREESGCWVAKSKNLVMQLNRSERLIEAAGNIYENPELVEVTD